MPRKYHRIIATPKDGGEPTVLTLRRGQNSLGEPGFFLGKRPGHPSKAFEALRGYPDYAATMWLVGHGYTYEERYQ